MKLTKTGEARVKYYVSSDGVSYRVTTSGVKKACVEYMERKSSMNWILCSREETDRVLAALVYA